MSTPNTATDPATVPGTDPATAAEAPLETVACFRCNDPGRLRFTAGPHGVRRCTSCGMVFISPRLDLSARSAMYDDAGYFEGGVYSGDGGDEGGLATFWQHRWAKGRLSVLDRYRDAEPGRMLEVGCAYGLFADHAIAHGWDVAAMDVSAAGVKQTSQRLGIKVFRGQVEDAPFEAGSFDAVAAWDVIEHVTDPSVFLAAVRGLLAPGGVVALSLPNVASPPARLLGSRWWTLRPSEHIWHFSPRTLTLTLRDAGFVRVAVTANPTVPGNQGRFDSMVAMATVAA